MAVGSIIMLVIFIVEVCAAGLIRVCKLFFAIIVEVIVENEVVHNVQAKVHCANSWFRKTLPMLVYVDKPSQ